MTNVEQDNENLSENFDEKTDAMKCPVCGTDIDRVGSHCIHPDSKVRTLGETCVFAGVYLDHYFWTKIINAFDQASRMNADAGLPEHLKQLEQ